MAKRLLKELECVTNMYDIELVNDNIYHWQLALPGPDDSPYYGGTFLVTITFPTTYPFASPTLLFQTKIYHPNINRKGEVCISMLGGGWKASFTVGDVLVSINALLVTPNPDDPLEPQIANQYNSNVNEYKKIAMDLTHKYAV